MQGRSVVCLGRYLSIFDVDTAPFIALCVTDLWAMITAVDVNYRDNGSARAAAVVFEHFSDAVPYSAYTADIPQVEAYIPGQFFRRELPCIIAVLEIIREAVSIIIVDGYVMLGDRPGLGFHVWQQLRQEKAVIGVAKSPYTDSNALTVIRGSGKNPLYVTSVGIEPAIAAGWVRRMEGKYRIPTLLKYADSLSKRTVKRND